MTDAFICDAIRTPFGRYGGSLAQVRTDDLGVRAFQNACRHRGVKIVEGRGSCHEAGFVCPFHGWCYGLDGANTAVTQRRTFAEHNLAPGDIGSGGKKDEMYAKEMAAFAAAHPDFGKSAMTAEDMAKRAADPATIAAGKTLFATNCVACHLPDGGGLIGPNLTDDRWIHGGTPIEVRNTINEIGRAHV